MDTSAIDLTTTARTAMQLLLQAERCAARWQLDIWQFAVEIDELWRAGVSNSDLRILLLEELAERADEVTRRGDRGRRFVKVRSLMLRTAACFVLTEEGRRVASQEGDGVAARKKLQTTGRDSGGQSAQDVATPFWDAKRHELNSGSEIVKRFTHRAPEQEAILAAFQEEGWPHAIEDPLPPKAGVSPQERRYQTVRNLNRAQRPLRIRFTVNADKQTIHWQPVQRRSRKS